MYAFARTKKYAAGNQLQIDFKSSRRQSNWIVELQKDGKIAARLWKRLTSFIRTLAEIALVAGLGYAVFHGGLFLIQSPRFQVSSVTVQGNQALSHGQLLNLMGPIRGKSIFTLDLGEMARRLTAHPWIHSVSIARHFPDGIQLHVRERTPYARIQFDRVYIMDNYGVLMGEDSPEYRRLPVITGMEDRGGALGRNVATAGLIKCLQVMHYLNRLRFFQGDPIDSLEIKSKSRVVFATRGHGLKIFVPLDAMTQSFENLKIVLGLIGQEQERFEYIDLSFKDKVVVKPAEQGAVGFQVGKNSI